MSDIIAVGFPKIGQISDSSSEERNELLLYGKMGIVASIMARMTGLHTAFLGGRRDLLRIKQIVGPIASSGLLRLTANKLLLKDADLTAKLVKFLL